MSTRCADLQHPSTLSHTHRHTRHYTHARMLHTDWMKEVVARKLERKIAKPLATDEAINCVIAGRRLHALHTIRNFQLPQGAAIHSTRQKESEGAVGRAGEAAVAEGAAAQHTQRFQQAYA